MLVQTGRLPSELPVAVVRGLICRAHAQRILPLIAQAKTSLPNDASLQARIDHAELVKAAEGLERELFPDG